MLAFKNTHFEKTSVNTDSFLSMFFIVSHCLSLSLIVSHCLSLSLIVSHCLSLSLSLSLLSCLSSVVWYFLAKNWFPRCNVVCYFTKYESYLGEPVESNDGKQLQQIAKTNSVW